VTTSLPLPDKATNAVGGDAANPDVCRITGRLYWREQLVPGAHLMIRWVQQCCAVIPLTTISPTVKRQERLVATLAIDDPPSINKTKPVSLDERGIA
jgi:hypothetical protein